MKITVEYEGIKDIPTLSKKHSRKLRTIAKQIGISTFEVQKVIILKYLQTEWDDVAQILMDKYFDSEYPKLSFEFDKQN
ncbi:hypothetical protein M1316_01165 [Candidatus Parvarchaeota archaeon]|nr:hypothetical protein [Candidatus Parvarchaeota archaeon]